VVEFTFGRDQPETSFEKLGDSPAPLKALTATKYVLQSCNDVMVAEVVVVVRGCP
jgi:hypothetical protein